MFCATKSCVGLHVTLELLLFFTDISDIETRMFSLTALSELISSLSTGLFRAELEGKA